MMLTYLKKNIQLNFKKKLLRRNNLLNIDINYKALDFKDIYKLTNMKFDNS